ncbi:MAG: hypothetical protein KC643_25845 [Nitrospira sp.]|nr:hypothetical protein [Nitrospira sp.]
MCNCCRVTVIESNLVVAWKCPHGLSWALKAEADAGLLTDELSCIEAALHRRQIHGDAWNALRLMKGAPDD